MRKLFLETSKDFVENYDIDNDNAKALEAILNYFSGVDTKEAPLSKGLLIRGSIGSGKTMTLKIIQKITKNFAITNIRDIVAEFNFNGFEGINDYVKKFERVIDDIGSESNGKYYGNDTDVVQELIIRRYELFQSKGLKTHFTTNLGTNDDILSKYGERAYDRLKEMCTLVILGNNTPSRRDKYKPIQKKEKIAVEKTESEIYKQMKKSVILSFESYKSGEDYYVKASIYDWLNKNEFLLPTPQRKREFLSEAKKQLDIELQEKKAALLNPLEIRKLLETYDNKTTLVNRAKELNLKDYFNGLIEMNEDINIILK